MKGGRHLLSRDWLLFPTIIPIKKPTVGRSIGGPLLSNFELAGLFSVEIVLFYCIT